MNLIVQLEEGITEIEKWRISRKDIVILAPPNTMANIEARYSMGCSRPLFYYNESLNKAPQFNGVLVIEDESHSRIVIRSLVSNHRVEISNSKGSGYAEEQLAKLNKNLIFKKEE